MRVGADVFCAGGFQHFASGVAHVLDHGAFVFAVGHMNLEDRDSVDVFHMGVEFDEIVPARKDFAKAGDIDARAGFAKSCLVSFAEAGGAPVKFRRGFTLVTKAAEKLLVGRLVAQIAEARDVNAEWLYGCAERSLCAEGGKFPTAAAASNVCGEVMAEDAAGIGEAIGILGCCGIQ